MNILFFVTEFPTLSETFIVNQIVDLRNKGHLVHIYSHQKPNCKIIHENILKAGLLNDTFYPTSLPHSAFSKVRKRFQLMVSKIPNTNASIIFKSLFRNKSTLSIYNFFSFVNKPAYDIVHAHFGVNGNLVTQFRKLGLFRKAKFITTFHGFDLNDSFAANNYYHELFNDCHAFTVNSLYSISRLINLGCPQHRITILPVGLNTSFFKKSTFNCDTQKKIRILFVGRLIKLKGPQLLIEICKMLMEKKQVNFQVDMIGNGEMEFELTKQIESNGLSEVVNLKGPMTQEGILDEMNKSDIFILPGINDGNRAEAQGLVIQEAQAMQLPVIISDAGGMKEGIIDGVTGFVVKENDIDGFVEKIELLAADVNLRKKIGEQGRKFVIYNYDIEKLNDQLMNIYIKN